MGHHARTGILRGVELRYVLTAHLMRRGSATLAELTEVVEAAGFQLGGRASKVVSDALRWEVGRRRVERRARGRYAVGSIPRGTQWRIIQRVGRLHSEVARRRAVEDAGGGLEVRTRLSCR